MINKQHLIADEGNLNQSGRLILCLGEMANNVCCTAVDPTTEAHISLSFLRAHYYLRTILASCIEKLYLPPHGKVRDENANVEEEGSRGRHKANQKYREDSSTFEMPYFVAKVTKMVANVRGPDVAAVSNLILTPVKLSSQP
ncbi:hypothetical protein AVEN_179743-1 [Araneus ventricosus]|uniref:Uncharacterized protein n=1 Tax=Araneus ventricosus TaxID=182803 RepID=A0A4Y2G6B6_ARAVE|nr:hypothetical protein AVEN_179743-1 [Araneus ventricosus]